MYKDRVQRLRHLKYLRKYRKRNAAKIHKYMREYRLKNLERVKAQERATALRNRKQRMQYKRKHIKKIRTWRKKYNRKHKNIFNVRQTNWARTITGQYSYSKCDAKRRELVFKIPFEKYVILRSQPCDYCGGSLPETCIGLDRLDNSKGYTPGNVVPCCTTCNLIRGRNLTHDEMKVAMHAVLEYRKNLENTVKFVS